MSDPELLEQHLAWCALNGARPLTVGVKRRLLRFMDASMPNGLLGATKADLTMFLSRPLAAQTRANYIAHARVYYQWTIEEGLGTADPTARMRMPKIPRGTPHPISDADLRMALDEAPEPLRTWFLLASHQGLRSFEIAPLAAEDIVDGRLLIRDGKGGRSDWLPMHALVAERLGELAALGPGRFWPDARNTRVTARCNHWLKTHGSTSTLHACRHWAATSILRSSGGNLRVAQELLRHSSPATTARYTQVLGAELSAALAGVGLDVA